MVGQANPCQQLRHTLVDFATRQLTGEGQRQRDVVGHGLGRQQVEVLENHPDLLTETSQAVGIQRRDFFTIDDDLAATGVFQAIDQAQQGTFSRTGMADQAKDLTVLNRQTGRMQGGNILTGDAVSFVDV